ncbi:MAG: hypothetical protein ACRDHP_17390, partial [Ktedonobacterales bacterium]
RRPFKAASLVRRPLWTVGKNDGHAAGLQPAQAGFVAGGHQARFQPPAAPAACPPLKVKVHQGRERTH